MENYMYKVFTETKDYLSEKVIGTSILTDEFDSYESAKERADEESKTTEQYRTTCYIKRYDTENGTTIIGDEANDTGVYVFSIGEDIVNYVLKEYSNDDTELNSLFFEFDVIMKEADILLAYARIQKLINGDDVVRMENGEICDDFIPEGQYEDVYDGNCKEFLESFNTHENETGFYRFDEDEQLDFVW